MQIPLATDAMNDAIRVLLKIETNFMKHFVFLSILQLSIYVMKQFAHEGKKGGSRLAN